MFLIRKPEPAPQPEPEPEPQHQHQHQHQPQPQPQPQPQSQSQPKLKPQIKFKLKLKLKHNLNFLQWTQTLYANYKTGFLHEKDFKTFNIFFIWHYLGMGAHIWYCFLELHTADNVFEQLSYTTIVSTALHHIEQHSCYG